MTVQERKHQKELLLMKGQLLRYQLCLELEEVARHPVRTFFFEGFSWWAKSRQFFSLLVGVLPQRSRMRRLLEMASLVWLVGHFIKRRFV